MEAATGYCFEDYAALHAWSVEEAEDFWRAAWSFLDLQGEPGDTVIDDLHHMPGASWFPDGRVSFAGTILREADDRPAIRARGEHQDQWRTITRRELHEMVGAAAEAMRQAGVVEGDRVEMGTLIGHLAAHGFHCSRSCLHLGLRRPAWDARDAMTDPYVDPWAWIERRPVLKPLVP